MHTSSRSPLALRNLLSRSRRAAFALAALAFSLSLTPAGAHAQNLYTFSAPIGVGSSSSTTPISVKLATTGTPVSQVEVLTAGAPGLDFTESGSDNCSGITSGSCTVPVVFSARFPGQRNGAVVLLDAGGDVLGSEYLTGTALGSLGVAVPGQISIAAGKVGEWTDLNDGQLATAADLDLPSGVAVDGAGNVFIADSKHNRVREIVAATGKIITVAGNGDPSYNPAQTIATQATLTLPGGVAVDGAGILYIADSDNNVVRAVNLASGKIWTVAGNGNPGYTGDDGTAVSAELNSPQAIAADSAGNLYISDTGNNVIREVSGGTITTMAGTGTQGYAGDNGPATAAKLSTPYGITFDASGNLYIADSGNNVIRQIDTAKNIHTYAGSGSLGYSGDGGPATSAQLYSPYGVACDPAGNLYIADARNYVVRKVSSAPGNVITTVAGEAKSNFYLDGKSDFVFGNQQNGDYFGGNGVATGAGIFAPYAVALDATGNLYIAEYNDDLIRKVTVSAATLFYTPAFWQNQKSAPQPQIIENDGNAALSFSSVAAVNDAAVDSTTCSTAAALGVDEQCVVQADYDPTHSGNPLVGNIDVTDTSGNTPIDIQLVGEALAQDQVNVTLTNSPTPSNFGQSVSLSIAVQQAPGSTAGTPTGSVTLTDSLNGGAATSIGGILSLVGGSVTFKTTSLAVGTHTIIASYGGDTHYQPANSNPVSQVVTEQVTVTVANTSNNNPATYGAGVTLSATVAITGSVPLTGPVTFYNGTSVLGTAAVGANGIASYGTAALPVGVDSITASFTDVNGVTGTSKAYAQQVVQQTTTTVSSSVNPSVHGSPVAFSVSVQAAGTVPPGGKVAIFDGTTQIALESLTPTGPVSSGVTWTTSSLAAGQHSITAQYAGETNDSSSNSAPLIEVVNEAATTTALKVNANPGIAGGAITFAATVQATGGTATGSVNFYNGALLLGTSTLNGSGVATYSPTNLAVGTYSITAAYQGDSNNSASTSPALAYSVIQATSNIQLSASNASIIVTSPVTLTAKLATNGGVPTGSVIFMDGTNNLGSGTINGSGVASFTTSSLALGAHSITAVYGGDAKDAGTTSAAVTVTVTAYASQTILAASPTTLYSNQQLSLLATVSSAGSVAPTGTVTFLNGKTTLGTTTLGANGSATLSLTPNVGNYTITAQYSGDALNAPSVSVAVTVTVAQATAFAIQLSPPSVNIPSTQYANVNVQLASLNGFSDTLTLGCANLPFSITCNFANPSVKLDANGNASVMLTVDTNSPLTSGGQAKNERPGSGSPMLLACVFPGAALFGFAFWRFRRNAGMLRMLAIVAMLAGTTFLMTGCGGITYNSAKAGSYVIQVTATGQNTGVMHAANLTVQVTQ